MGLVDFKEVGFRYPGSERDALSNISFSIEKGSRVAVIGGNGSGKSTLTRLMTGLLIPDRGEVSVAGRDTRQTKNHRSIRKRAGLVFQNPTTQIVATVVREDAAFGPENLALEGPEIRERVEAALDSLSLSPLSRRGTHQLSAGQQQRLALAGVLALGAGCLILDEAESMLNPLARRRLDVLLDDLHRKGHSIIRITHFMEQAARADHVLILHEGRLVRQGGPELLREEGLEKWKLSPTPLEALLREMRRSPGIGIAEEELEDIRSEEALGRRLAGSASFQILPASDAAVSDLAGGESAEVISGANVSGSDVRGDGSRELISLSQVGRSYSRKTDSPVEALKDADFSLKAGESVAVLGRTGSGKSTFLQILNSLLLPDSGEVRILGENPRDRNCDLRSLRTRIALVMQQPEKQLFAPLTGDDVAYGPRLQGLEGRELAIRVRDAMDRAGLPYKEFRDLPVRALSGGRKRKAALAGILAMEPEVLLLDEPTAGLDPLSAHEMEEMFRQLRDEGTTLVTVTHNVEQALRLAPERFVVFSGGRIVHDGSPAAFFSRFDPEELGLEYPLAARVALQISGSTGGDGTGPGRMNSRMNSCGDEAVNASTELAAFPKDLPLTPRELIRSLSRIPATDALASGEGA